MESMSVCPSCKAAFVPFNRAAIGPSHLSASRECWNAFSLLMSRFYTSGNGLFPYRQWPIDAYMLQHARLDVGAGARAATLSLATARIALAAPSSVARGPHLHQRMMTARDMPKLLPPHEPQAALTLQSMLNLSEEQEIITAAHEWAKVAVARWEDSLPLIDAWLKRHDYFMEH